MPALHKQVKAFISIFIKMSLTIGQRNVISINMETRIATQSATAIAALGALAQEHRLALFRLLVQAGEPGMSAGAIADALGVPNSSLSFHLAQLSRAGLIRQERQHRSLIYRADYAAMNRLVAYLMENCCAGAGCGPDVECAETDFERETI
jgi:ArsR family transcriptional regulator, arsenate/arsenite/antimonite-responsive transcriptional repressor